jgi:hypothetical protein
MAVDEMEVVGEAEGAGAALVAAAAYLEEAARLQDDDDCLNALSQAEQWVAFAEAQFTQVGATEMASLAGQMVTVLQQAIAAGITPDLATWHTQTVPELQADLAAVVLVPAGEEAEARHEVEHSGWLAFWGFTGCALGILVTAAVADNLAEKGKLGPRPERHSVFSVRYG